jgi:hypothetical protein
MPLSKLGSYIQVQVPVWIVITKAVRQCNTHCAYGRQKVKAKTSSVVPVEFSLVEGIAAVGEKCTASFFVEVILILDAGSK